MAHGPPPPSCTMAILVTVEHAGQRWPVPHAAWRHDVAIIVCPAAQQVGAWMLWSTWPLVIAIRESRVQDHPLFSYDDAEGASQALFPKNDSGTAADV